MYDDYLIEAVTRAFASGKERIATPSKAKSKANKVYEVAVSGSSTTTSLFCSSKSD